MTPSTRTSLQSATAAASGERDRPASGSIAGGRQRVVHLTTIPITLRFLSGMVARMQDRGYRVHVVSTPEPELDEFARARGVAAHGVVMARRITPLADLAAVARLVAVLRRVRPAIVHAHTPKAGLLGMVAARIAGTPVRIYHVHGMPFVTARGLKRALLGCAERVASAAATDVLCVSRSLRDFVVAEGFCPADKIRVLLHGSVCGVDARGEFDPSARRAAREEVRRRCGIPDEAPVVGYIGRVVRDKGMVELAAAWARVRETHPDAHLLLVGPWEPHDPLPRAAERALRCDPSVHVTGPDWNAPPLFAAMDVFVLPTYREGLPVVLLEAGAMAVPVVATRVSGCVDVVVDGVTGTLVGPRDAVALARAIAAYLSDPGLRRSHGQAARRRVLERFDPDAVHEAMLEFYENALSASAVHGNP